MSEEKEKLISVFIDEVEVKVPPATNMIEAAALVGKEIPHYCYHPKLSVVGNCRMCLVELGIPMRDHGTGQPVLDLEGKPKIGWMPRPAIACATNAVAGIHIRTDSALAKECRRGVMEFLLVNHPLDCPICDQAGECLLQEFATDYGRGYSRFIEKKVVKPKRVRLGPRVMLDDERCILCSRCIRFCQEIVGDDVLGFIDRGSYSTLTCYPGKELENNYSLNTVDICPVGALTSIDFRFKMRVWFLKETPSISTESSVGVNILVGSREGKIYRLTPRRNDAVNDTWMPDSGRLFYRTVESEDRLKDYTLAGEWALPETALSEATALIKAGGAAFVGSGQSSLEEQFLLRKIAEAAGHAPAWLVSRTGEGDGLLISEDRNPNVRGALVTGLIHKLPEKALSDLTAKIEAGEVKTVVSVGEDLLAAGVPQEAFSSFDVIYFGTHRNATSERAKIVIPTLTVFEKSGSFINQQFRIQKFLQVVPGPAGVPPDLNSLAKLLAMLRAEKSIPPTLEQIWKQLGEEIPQLAGLAFAGIPEDGLVIDYTAWSDLPFIEGKTLHYDPVKRKAL